MSDNINGNNCNIILDSLIIKNLEEIEFIEKELKKIDPLLYKNKNLRLKLFYRMTKEGKEPQNFYNKCTGIIDNLILIKTNKGLRFGGISSSPWHSGVYTRQYKSFCFSIDLKKIYNAIENSITHMTRGLPYFYGNCGGHPDQMIQIIYENQILYGKCGIKDNGSFRGQEKDYEINGGYCGFNILEWEAFEMIWV